MRVLLAGSKGMLGTDMMSELKSFGHDVLGVDKDEYDITKRETPSLVVRFSPELIINCAAYTNVDLAEKERKKCYMVNVEGVKNLIALAKKMDAALMQISTDYVFDGSKESYDEDDEKNPLNYYGETKSLSEDQIRVRLEKYYIVRTSWLFGKNGKNFVETVKRLCSSGKEVRIVDDQIGCPTYTCDLAKAVCGLIGEKYGVYHITNSEPVSWYEYALEIARQAGLKCEILPCTSDDYKSAAKRPKRSVLNNNRTFALRSWREALNDYLKEV